MMIRIAFCCFILGYGALAHAQIYTCDAATNLAKTGARSGMEVSVTKDYDQNECRFSINGAPTGSPPQADIDRALRLVSEGVMGKQIAVGDVEPLAYLLLSAARDTSIPTDLRETLYKSHKLLAVCFEQFEAGQLIAGQSVIFEEDVSCGVLSIGQARLRTLLARTGVAVEAIDESQHILGVAVSRTSTNVEHYLFIPHGFGK